MGTSEILKWGIDHLWLLVSVAVTIAIVQMFKVPFKHYFPAMDKVTRKMIIFLFAFFAGYLITQYLMAGDPEQKKWAATIAFLNPAIYIGLLAYATKKRMLWLVAILKARRFVVRDDVEKVIDHDDKTMMYNPVKRHDDK